MIKTIKQLSKEIAEHLGVDPLPIKFEDMEVISRIDELDKYLDFYIKNNIRIM